jgi:hypothetical protein
LAAGFFAAGALVAFAMPVLALVDLAAPVFAFVDFGAAGLAAAFAGAALGAVVFVLFAAVLFAAIPMFLREDSDTEKFCRMLAGVRHKQPR